MFTSTPARYLFLYHIHTQCFVWLGGLQLVNGCVLPSKRRSSPRSITKQKKNNLSSALFLNTNSNSLVQSNFLFSLSHLLSIFHLFLSIFHIFLTTTERNHDQNEQKKTNWSHNEETGFGKLNPYGKYFL